MCSILIETKCKVASAAEGVGLQRPTEYLSNEDGQGQRLVKVNLYFAIVKICSARLQVLALDLKM